MPLDDVRVPDNQPGRSSDRSGCADVAVAVALDDHAVDAHLQTVADKAGRVDISFNATVNLTMGSRDD